MNLGWTSEAEQDRQDIFDYVRAENSAAAPRIDAAFDRVVEKLASFPEMGRMGKLPNTREISVGSSYRVVYQIIEETAWILAIVHTARRWPPFRQ